MNWTAAEEYTTSLFTRIVYSDDEINILQSAEHSNQGIDIPNNFDSLKDGYGNIYCKFEGDIVTGAKDHRGYFEIVSVK